jgi:hypothetical protein
VAEQRLPVIDGDDGNWGVILNQFLSKEHYDSGADNPVNGGHKTVTIKAGTATAGTAPLKFTSGVLLTTPEAGAIEFNNDKLYFTNTSGPTRQTVATYDTSGSTGDLYYRDASGNFVRLPIGSTNNVLQVTGGVPVWAAPSGGSSGITRSISNISTATTAGATAATDYTYVVTGTTTVTLPTAVSNTNQYTITNSGSNTVTVATTSSQTINGSTSVTLPIATMSLTFVSNGSNWVIQ